MVRGFSIPQNRAAQLSTKARPLHCNHQSLTKESKQEISGKAERPAISIAVKLLRAWFVLHDVDASQLSPQRYFFVNEQEERPRDTTTTLQMDRRSKRVIN